MSAESDRTILTQNRYQGWNIYPGPPKLVVIHSTRSGRSEPTWTDGREAQATINWFLSPNSQASAHWVISATEKIRMVKDSNRSWHAKEFSHVAYGIELTQPLPNTPYTEGHYRNLVEVCRDYVATGVPIRHVGRISQLAAEGFTGHEETAQGVQDGKSDPGPPFDWDKFMAMLTPEEEDDKMLKLISTTHKGAYWAFITDGIGRWWVPTPAIMTELQEKGLAPKGAPTHLTAAACRAIPAHGFDPIRV